MIGTRQREGYDIDHLAARWYARQRSGEMTGADEQAMQAWLEADPQHRAAYDSVAMAWSALAVARDHPRLLAMREALPPEPPRLLARFVIRRAIAAALVAGVLGVAASTAWIAWGPSSRLADQAFQTGVGQKTTVSLPDGTEVTLNTGTRLRTRADAERRLVYLDQGQAYFKVAKNRAHPFVVHAGGRTITALGTAFDVRVGPDRFSVTLVEGKVRVEQPVRPADTAAAPARARPTIEATELAPGSELTAIDDEQWTVARTDTAKVTGWVRDQLIFEREPLSAVVEEMNRYSVRKIVIADASVAGTLVSGNFRPGDVEGFAQAIEAYRYGAISAETPQMIELSEPPAK